MVTFSENTINLYNSDVLYNGNINLANHDHYDDNFVFNFNSYESGGYLLSFLTNRNNYLYMFFYVQSGNVIHHHFIYAHSIEDTNFSNNVFSVRFTNNPALTAKFLQFSVRKA